MKIHFALLLCLLLALGSTGTLYAQGNLIIKGKVIDADDRLTISYANIGIPKKGIGTVTNENGEFVFIVPSASAGDSLQVSCMGYANKRVAVSSFSNGQQAVIILSKSNIQLKPVSIEYRDPMKIIQKAIARIPDNYINKPHVIRGFYREYTKDAAIPLQLSEAVFDIFNYGYGDKREEMLKLVKVRDEKNQRDFHNLEVGQKAGSVINHDIVRRITTSDVFGSVGSVNENFEVKGIVDYKGIPAYEIDFTEKPGIKKVTFRGKVLIDTKTYAFLLFDIATSPEGMAYVQIGNFAERMLMKLMNTHLEVKKDEDEITYQKVGDKYVLAGVTSSSILGIKSAVINHAVTANIKFNYLVTQVDTTQTTPFDTKMGDNQKLIDHDTNEGEEFWKDYNIMLADFKTEDVFKQIKAINNIARLKEKFEEKEKKLPKDPALRIDSMLTFYHANGQFNGTALIKSKGKVILSKSYGYADKEKKLTANEQTTYRIGSTAKTFTSVIINQLISEGKLDLHVPIKTYIPYYIHGDVTIEQLLTHQSGIPNYTDDDVAKAAILTQSFTLKDLVTKFCSDTLEFKSGTSFNYSNSGFLVLALIAQEVTNKPFNTLLQGRIFTPLEMTESYSGMYKGVDPHKAIGYTDGVPEHIYDSGNNTGAGSISSSAADMMKYHDGLLANKLLPKQQKDEMLKPRVEFKDYNGWYDYGWMTDKDAFEASHKHVITYHPGTDVGFFTMFARQEDNDSCIILLNNTGDFPRYDMTDLILNMIN